MSEGARWRVNPEFEQEWEGSSARATEVVLNVIRTAEALHARITVLVKAHGLPSTTALIVLEVLRGERGPLQPSIIAERCFLSRPALSSVLSTLEQRGLVTRAAHPSDRRHSLVEITPPGLELMENLLPHLHRAEVRLVDPALSPLQQEQLLKHLAKLQGHLESLDADADADADAAQPTADADPAGPASDDG
jgi:DNA-binding MarR family transcriptional regulator